MKMGILVIKAWLRSIPLWSYESDGELDPDPSSAPKAVANAACQRRARVGDYSHSEGSPCPHTLTPFGWMPLHQAVVFVLLSPTLNLALLA